MRFIITFYVAESEGDYKLDEIDFDRGDKQNIASLINAALEAGWSTYLVEEGHSHEHVTENAKIFWRQGADMDIDPEG